MQGDPLPHVRDCAEIGTGFFVKTPGLRPDSTFAKKMAKEERRALEAKFGIVMSDFDVVGDALVCRRIA